MAQIKSLRQKKVHTTRKYALHTIKILLPHKKSHGTKSTIHCGGAKKQNGGEDALLEQLAATVHSYIL